jgi:hypothetical protein
MIPAMKLRLDQFSCEALTHAAHRTGSDSDAVLDAAVSHYLNERDRGRAAWPVPRFLRAERRESSFDINLPGGVREALEAEAERQQVTVERLAEHALLLYVADLDRGRIDAPGRPNGQ